MSKNLVFFILRNKIMCNNKFGYEVLYIYIKNRLFIYNDIKDYF